MLDIKFIKENADIVKMGIAKKRISFDLDELLRIDVERLELLAAVEKLRAEQNEASQKIGALPAMPGHADGKEDGGASMGRDALIESMKSVKETLQKKENELQQVMARWRTLMLQVPNVPDMSVPEGESDADNEEVKTWGDKPKFSFAPRTHVELMTMHDMADFERGAKVAGFRGYFLKNDGALLVYALWQFVVAEFTSAGFMTMMVPSLVRKEVFFGTGYLPQGEDDLYKTQDEEYLAGTGEVATMGYFMDEILAKEDLPKKIIAFSPCFRREAGSHGKDTKGIFRVHEFFKFEQVVLCEANHETSVRFHEELTENAEKLLQKLNLPYHVVINCGGDLGLGQVKKYDIEAWVPSERTYRETHSSSYFHDFQTRRLNIRYRDTDGKLRFVHSLNNTALAMPRILVSILENYQQADGSIAIPEVLRAYMGKDNIVLRQNS